MVEHIPAWRRPPTTSGQETTDAGLAGEVAVGVLSPEFGTFGPRFWPGYSMLIGQRSLLSARGKNIKLVYSPGQRSQTWHATEHDATGHGASQNVAPQNVLSQNMPSHDIPLYDMPPQDIVAQDIVAQDIAAFRGLGRIGPCRSVAHNVPLLLQLEKIM